MLTILVGSGEYLYQKLTLTSIRYQNGEEVRDILKDRWILFFRRAWIASLVHCWKPTTFVPLSSQILPIFSPTYDELQRLNFEWGHYSLLMTVNPYVCRRCALELRQTDRHCEEIWDGRSSWICDTSAVQPTASEPGAAVSVVLNSSSSQTTQSTDRIVRSRGWGESGCEWENEGKDYWVCRTSTTMTSYLEVQGMYIVSEKNKQIVIFLIPSNLAHTLQCGLNIIHARP